MSDLQVLPARDLELLAFERTTWKYPARKAAAVRERFGCSVVRYYQRLQHLISQPAADLYDPELVRRLRRERLKRREQRTVPMSEWGPR